MDVVTRPRRQSLSASAIEQVRGHFNTLRGELFGLVDATGMTQKQEDAWKRLIRATTYDCQLSLEKLVSQGERRG